MIATVCLTVVCLALVAFIAWREREHRAQLSEFADRIQAPEARQVAAMEAALMPRVTPTPPELVLAPFDEDFRIDAILNVES